MDKYKTNKEMINKINHIFRCAYLARIIEPKNELLYVACLFHDIGRFPQYEETKSFNDKLKSHYALGRKLLVNDLNNGQLKPSDDLDKVMLSVSFHGLSNQRIRTLSIPDDAKEMVKSVKKIDEIDNGIFGTLSYLEDEIINDSKDYRKNNPNLKMDEVSFDVWNFYQNGEWFDKMVYCKTYADYLLFAATLVIIHLKENDRETIRQLMLLPIGRYSNVLEGYRDLFNRYITPKYAKSCWQIFLGYYLYGKDYHFESDNLDENIAHIDLGKVIAESEKENTLNTSKNYL